MTQNAGRLSRAFEPQTKLQSQQWQSQGLSPTTSTWMPKSRVCRLPPERPKMCQPKAVPCRTRAAQMRYSSRSCNRRAWCVSPSVAAQFGHHTMGIRGGNSQPWLTVDGNHPNIPIRLILSPIFASPGPNPGRTQFVGGLLPKKRSVQLKASSQVVWTMREMARPRGRFPNSCSFT